MSAGVAQPIADSQTAKFTVDGLELSVMYQVPVTSPYDGTLTVLFAPGLPRPGAFYFLGNEVHPLATCSELTPSRVAGTRLLWHVLVTYRTPGQQNNQQGNDDNGKPTSDPLAWHDEIEIHPVRFSVPLEEAELIEPAFPGRQKNSKGPVTNSARVPFNPPAEVDRSRFVFRLTKNLNSYPDAQVEAYQDSMNSDRFTINKRKLGFVKTFDKFQCKMLSISTRMAFANGRSYWPVTYEIDYDKKGWDLSLLDKGLAASVRPGDPDGNGGTISASDLVLRGRAPVRRLVDAAGVPLSEPVLLDGQGQPLAEGGTPVYLKYRGYVPKPYGALRL